MELTKEQKEIVKAVKDMDRLAINAFAGTGKTHILEAIARSYPSLKFLVLTYNRSVKNELKKRLPSNCAVYTVHGLAYKHFNEQGGNSQIKEKELTEKILELLGLKGTAGYAYCLFLKDLVSAYFQSTETRIEENTINRLILRHPGLRIRMNIIKDHGLGDIQKIKDDLEYIVYAFDKGAIPLVHEYYLKVFQLNIEQYQDFFSEFDVLMVDEGHDLNGTQMYIIEHAQVKKKIVCGDKHQAIYAWRGAYNALGALKDWRTFFLTTSFRFRSEKPVELANAFLKNWKGEQAQIVMGKSQVKTNLTAYISRTAAGLLKFVHYLDEPVRFTRGIEEIFRTARIGANVVQYYQNGGKKEYLEGVPYHIRLLIEGEKLKSAQELANKLIHEIGDLEHGYAISLATRYDIEALYRKAKAMENEYARTVLSTAHSAKGLQFDRVNFASDFPTFDDLLKTHASNLLGGNRKIEKEDIRKILQGIQECAEEQGDVLDELNLQYVAVTRAIEELSEGLGALERNMTSKPDVERLYKMLNKKGADGIFRKMSSDEDTF